MAERLKKFAVRLQALSDGHEETVTVIVRGREDAVAWGNRIEMRFKNTTGAVKVLSVEEVLW